MTRAPRGSTSPLGGSERDAAWSLRIREGGLFLLGVVMVVAGWDAAVRVLGIPPYLFPAPGRILRVAAADGSGLVSDLAITLLEAGLGWAAGCVAGASLGVVFSRFRRVERAFAPYFVALQAVPIVATAPLVIIWFGNGILSKVVLAAMVCFFPMLVNCSVGLGQTPQEALDLMAILGASPRQALWKVRIPYALPHIFSGLRVTSALSVVGAVVAELAGATNGIGFRILVASYRTDTPMLFAAIIAAALGSVALYQSVLAVEARFLSSRGR